MSTQKKKTPPDNKTTIKRFLFTVEEYFRFCSFYSNEQKLTDNAKELKYISLQTKLILIRKYESHTDACYLGEVLKAAITEYPDCKTRWDTLRKRLENIEHNQLEVLLSDGTAKNMHMAIEDVMYGLYLHGDDNKIADLLKTNMTTYLFAVEKYVSFWEELLLDTRTYITDVFSETYTRNPPKMASVIFAGTDKRQPQNIKSVPYWSNLRGWDITPTEGQEILSTLPPEDLKILVLVHTFINELQKDKYSYKKLCKMIHPVTKSYWKDFSAAHIAVHNLNLGFSSKVRYNETHNIAYVLLFNNFNHDGSFMINQPQYSEDIASIYLMKDNERSAWKITSFNIEPDKMIKTITISPFKTVKKILTAYPKNETFFCIWRT